MTSSADVGGATRHAVVTVLSRIFALNSSVDQRQVASSELLGLDLTDSENFTQSERALIQDELLQRVVIGMGRLDYESDGGNHNLSSLRLLREASPANESTADNYFAHSSPSQSASSSCSTTPTTSSSSTASPPEIPGDNRTTHLTPSPEESFNDSGDLIKQPIITVSDTLQSEFSHQSSHSQAVTPPEEDELDVNQASIGRLSSMSLMAAVVASGTWRSYFTEVLADKFIQGL